MQKMNSKWVGKRLRSIRMSKQLSQEAVANDLGLSLTGYANIESGKTNVPFNRLVEITNYFNVTIHHFFNSESTILTAEENEPVYSTKIIENLQKEIAYLKQIILEKDKIIALLERKGK